MMAQFNIHSVLKSWCGLTAWKCLESFRPLRGEKEDWFKLKPVLEKTMCAMRPATESINQSPVSKKELHGWRLNTIVVAWESWRNFALLRHSSSPMTPSRYAHHQTRNVFCTSAAIWSKINLRVKTWDVNSTFSRHLKPPGTCVVTGYIRAVWREVWEFKQEK